MMHAGLLSRGKSPNNRWFLVLLAIAVMPFVLSAGYALLQIFQSKQDDVAEHLIIKASDAAQVVRERLASSVSALNALANSDAALQGDLPALYQHAQRLMGRMPENSGIWLTSQNGLVVFSTFQPFDGPTFPSRAPEVWKRVFDLAQPQVSEPYTNPINQQRVVSLGVPVFRQSKVAYSMSMVFTTHSINDLLMAQQLPEKWSIEIVSQSGKLVAHSRPSEIDVDKLMPEEIMAAKGAKFSGLINTTAKDGTQNRVILAPIGNFDWTVVVTTPLDTLNAPVQRVVILLIIYGGAFAIMGGLATVWLAYLGKDAPSNAPQKRQPIATSNSRTLLGPALAALMASILLGGYTAWLTQGNLQRIAESVDSQQENHAEQRHIEELNYLFKELETGQSGFASTGNAFFLDYFYSASKRLPALVEHIKSDFSKPDQQEFNWADFDNLSDQYAKITAKVIAVRQTSGAPLALDDALFTDGKRLLNKLRLQVDEMSNRLDMRIKQGAIHIRSQRELASQQQWFSSFTVSALFLLSVVIWLYERQRRIHVYRQLEITNSELEDRVAQRTLDLATANQSLRSYAREVQALIDSERKRLSREVHDQVGQIFTAIKMIMGSLENGRLDTAQKVALLTAVDTGVNVSRRISAELRPPLLDDFGLLPAREHFLKSICESAGISYEVHFPAESHIANRQLSELFRIIQEACVNVVTHAKALHLEVVGTMSNNMLDVCVDDDGVGLDQAHMRMGALGIVGMRERSKLIDGQISFGSSPMGGTRVHIQVPLMQSGNGVPV